MRIVIKFGGTSLSTPEQLRKMAAGVKAIWAGNEIAVVVSAMGNTTSQLVALLKGVGKKDSDIWEVSGVVGMGEVISAKLMALALRGAGARAEAIVPSMNDWPVFADVIGSEILKEDKVNQEPLAVINLVKTQEACSKKIIPRMQKGQIPVLCGFLGSDDRGRTVAIGRGGSDISAVALGRCLGADRVIIVTDVPGVLRADPRVIRNSKSIEKISISELETLSRGGARVIHPSSLQYKLPGQELFIVDCKSRNFLKGGTQIVGKKQARVARTRARLACIMVVGRDFIGTPGLLNAVTDKLAKMKISIYGVTVSEGFIGVYVMEKVAERSCRAIFGVIESQPRFQALSTRKGIGRLRMSSGAFIEQPGVIGRIGDLLAMKGINIIEMVTIQSDITLFLDMEDLTKAYNLLRKLAF
ncbi:MAG: hypothetical protein ABIJ56_06525 [Pseudomonadota bacterium]